MVSSCHTPVTTAGKSDLYSCLLRVAKKDRRLRKQLNLFSLSEERMRR